jgi:drug/metabolite transporter (DMT)-like permease
MPHPRLWRYRPWKRATSIVTLVAWLFVCLIWSTVWLFIKLGVTDVPPFAFAATRLFIALAILVPAAWIGRVAVPGTWGDRRLIAITGVMLFTANYALLYWAAQHVSSGLMAVLQATTPAFALLLAQRLLTDEHITAANLAGLIAGIAGVAVIFADELHVSGPLVATACAAVLASAFFVAWAYVLVRARGSHLPSATLMTGQIACGLVPLSFLSIAIEGSPSAIHWSTTAFIAVCYLAIAGSIVAFWLNYWLMHRLGATRMLLTSILEPLLAVLLGAIVLGERLTSYVAVGGSLVLISVALVMKRE